jgi:hypothetical protein
VAAPNDDYIELFAEHILLSAWARIYGMLLSACARTYRALSSACARIYGAETAPSLISGGVL